MTASALRAGVSAALAVGIALSCGACARYSERVDVPAPQATLAPYVSVFQRNPSIHTWRAVHSHMRLGALDERSQIAIVRGLAARDVPERLDNAAAVDMATYAWSGSVETLRQENVRAQRIGSLPMAFRSARIAWLMMALRAGYLMERVDLSSMDLRDRSRFVGQSMNLRAVDFSGSRLSGATWHGCDLTWSIFARTTVDGKLTCAGCIWYPGGKPQGRTFVRGRWIP